MPNPFAYMSYDNDFHEFSIYLSLVSGSVVARQVWKRLY